MLFGGKITLVGPFEQKESHENIKFLKLERVANMVEIVKFQEMRNMSTVERLQYKIAAARDKVDFALSDEKFKEVLKSDETFDVMILDTLLNDALLGMAEYKKIPVIAFSSAGSSRWTDEMVKNPVNPSYSPSDLMEVTDSMSFMERMWNTAMTFVETFYYQ